MRHEWVGLVTENSGYYGFRVWMVGNLFDYDICRFLISHWLSGRLG